MVKKMGVHSVIQSLIRSAKRKRVHAALSPSLGIMYHKI